MPLAFFSDGSIDWRSHRTIRFRKEFKLWNPFSGPGGMGRRVRPQNSGWWGRVGGCHKIPIQPAEPLYALLYRHEHARNAEDVV